MEKTLIDEFLKKKKKKLPVRRNRESDYLYK